MPTTAIATSACTSAEREGEHDAALPGLLVGDEIGRDHCLAVAWARGVENPVREREPHQEPRGAAVGLGVADGAGKQPVEFGLLGEQPAGDASAEGGGGGGAPFGAPKGFCANASAAR